ncbi:helix-turn-helix transcriptional regulator, partial [Candidatus Azambacteria bacterium]|nr:helix-turn-helix transcriptional regulator [Candidatus Azambacteria bacterium]
QFKNQLLKDRQIKSSYGELRPEFEIISLMIKKRLEKGVTQAKLARLCGTKQAAISRFESGKYNPTLNFLYKLANGLNTKVKVSLSTK